MQNFALRNFRNSNLFKQKSNKYMLLHFNIHINCIDVLRIMFVLMWMFGGKIVLMMWMFAE